MIQPTGFAVLRELGLDGALLAYGARIDRLHGEAGSTGRVVLDVRYAALGKRAGFGVGIHRAALFALLHDAVAAEAIAVETGCAVIGSELSAADRRARHSGNALELRLDHVVGEVVELLLVEPLAAHHHLHDGNVGDVELENERLLNAGRKRV